MEKIIPKLLSFDIWGEFAVFRRPYSTTSPLTYPFPTRTAVAGFISAILGLDRNSYYDEFNKDNSGIGIQLLSPIRRTHIGQNLIATNKGYYLWDINENPRTQILFEVLKDPKFRIFAWLKNENLYNSLKNRLINHLCVYTPYLGLAPMIANFRFHDEFSNIKMKITEEGNLTNIVTIVPEEYNVIADSNHKLGRINMPVYMDTNRKPEFGSFIYDACSTTETTTINNSLLHQLNIRNGTYYEIDNDYNVVLF
jgi:CRISPR-associated protein Cas5h